MTRDIKIIVRDNILALLRLSHGTRGATAALIRLGVSNGEASRVLRANTSIGIDKIAQIAAALHVAPWVLCFPGPVANAELCAPNRFV